MKYKPKSVSAGFEVLQALFENGKGGLSQQFLRWKLWKKWAEFVGETTAQVCEPVGYVNGTLIIYVKNSSYLHHLSFLKETIRLKINEKVGHNYAKDLRFTMNRHEVPQTQEAKDELQRAIDILSDKKPEPPQSTGV